MGHPCESCGNSANARPNEKSKLSEEMLESAFDSASATITTIVIAFSWRSLIIIVSLRFQFRLKHVLWFIFLITCLTHASAAPHFVTFDFVWRTKCEKLKTIYFHKDNEIIASHAQTFSPQTEWITKDLIWWKQKLHNIFWEGICQIKSLLKEYFMYQKRQDRCLR